MALIKVILSIEKIIDFVGNQLHIVFTTNNYKTLHTIPNFCFRTQRQYFFWPH